MVHLRKGKKLYNTHNFTLRLSFTQFIILRHINSTQIHGKNPPYFHFGVHKAILARTRRQIFPHGKIIKGTTQNSSVVDTHDGWCCYCYFIGNIQEYIPDLGSYKIKLRKMYELLNIEYLGKIFYSWGISFTIHCTVNLPYTLRFSLITIIQVI